ncbi:hypothetical protein [Bradyrhizobium sp.]|uniref:hypothetical protein n=1 Tax=Bradyrhizobium sp. TaxID=376 RepID=UPI003C343820
MNASAPPAPSDLKTIAWEGRAWVPKDDYRQLWEELKNHMWWERSAVELQLQRDALLLRLCFAESLILRTGINEALFQEYAARYPQPASPSITSVVKTL